MEDTLYILYCIVVSMFFGVNVQDAGGNGMTKALFRLLF